MGATGIYWVERLKILPSILQWTGQPHSPSPSKNNLVPQVNSVKDEVSCAEGKEGMEIWGMGEAECVGDKYSRELSIWQRSDLNQIQRLWRPQNKVEHFFYWICYFRIRQPITLLVKIGVFYGCLKLMTLLSKWLFHFLCVCMHMKRRATQCKHMDHLEGGSG